MQHWQHLMESGTDPNSPLNTICVCPRDLLCSGLPYPGASVSQRTLPRVFSLGGRSIVDEKTFPLLSASFLPISDIVPVYQSP